MATRKVTITLDDDLLDQVERGRAAAGLSRSEYIAHAVDVFIEHERTRRLADRDRRGYLAHPETAAWSGAADQLAAESWADHGWEECTSGPSTSAACGAASPP
jgi:metal-responsive CopG/Arc/MetJ family transcriptional regulator